MKYIKTYKIFESTQNEIIQDVKDMLLELNDEGFITSCELIQKRMSEMPIYPREEQTYEIYIKKVPRSDLNIEKVLVFWEEIKEVVFRIDDFTHQNLCRNRFFTDGTELNVNDGSSLAGRMECVKNYAFFAFRILITIP